MQFSNLRTIALAIAAAALLTPALAAQAGSKQSVKLPPPANYVISVSGMSPGPGRVELQWQAIPSALTYRIERRKIDPTVDPDLDARRPTTPFLVIADRHPAISYTETGLWNDATYEYRVGVAQFDPKASSGSVGSVSPGIVKVTTAP